MNIRWLTIEDKEALDRLHTEKGSALSLPKEGALAGKFVDGKLAGVIGVQRPLVVEFLVAESGRDARDLIIWLDGKLDPQPYACFVSNPEFADSIQRYYGDVTEQFDGKLVLRRRP